MRSQLASANVYPKGQPNQLACFGLSMDQPLRSRSRFSRHPVSRRGAFALLCAALLGAWGLYSSHRLHFLGVIAYFVLIAAGVLYALWQARVDVQESKPTAAKATSRDEEP